MVKTITERPLILANITKQTWHMRYDAETKQFNFFDTAGDKQVKIKEETKNTGVFELAPNDRSWEVILPNGTISRLYECKRANINWEFSSFQSVLNVLKKLKRKEGWLTRKKITYYNPQTKETTSDKAVALAWFPDKDPLIINACPYQRVGMWVSPGPDYVDVSIYYINGLSRKDICEWTKADDSGFRLYNDGTVSHFWTGKVYDENRTFEENRRTYHQLDIRSKKFYRSMGNMADLRSPELVGADSDVRYLCKGTLDILKKAGFPEHLWCWGNFKRKFEDSYDLVNFARFPQRHKQTKNGASIEEFLKDKPFTPECQLIESFNKGVLIRIPGFFEEWKDGRGQFYHYKPYVISNDVVKLVNASCYERYRIWLSNDGKKRSCQELVHDKTEWKRVNWDNIPFIDESSLDPRDVADLTAKEQRMYKEAWEVYKKMASKKLDKIFTLLPALQHIKEFIAQYPQSSQMKNLKSILTAMYEHPKTTETIIKMGHGDWFFDNQAMRRYYSGGDDYFSLDKVLYKFGLSSHSYKEDKRKSIYQNLGVSKEQFEWLGSYKHAYDFMSQFRDISIPIPGKHLEYYDSFATVPLKYLLILAQCCEVWGEQRFRRDNYYAYEVASLIRNDNFTPLDVQKIIDKNLDLSELQDYLRMRRELRNIEDFHIDDWNKVPEDNTDLHFCHNRIVEFYNFYQANRERYYREQQEKRLLQYQENYAKRYKTLKSLAYQNETDTRCIVVPEKLIELTVEGQVLHHCVGSFAESVSEGRDTIVFLRRKEAPKVSYATISLLKHGDQWYIDQAHTKNNGPITEEDVKFLKDWAKDHNVDTSSIKTTYSWKCHH